MKIEWTESATGDLESVYQHIAQGSKKYASVFVENVKRRCELIGDFPFSGQMVPEYSRIDLREFLVYSYRVLYLVTDHAIYVLGIVHGAKPLPENVGPSPS